MSIVTRDMTLVTFVSEIEALRRVAFESSDGRITSDKFVSRVVATRRTILDHGGLRWAIFMESDYYAFSVAFVALLSLGCTIFLPSEIESSTMQRLSEEVDGLIGDFPKPSVPSVTSPDFERPAAALPGKAFDGVDARRARIIIYTSGSSGEPKRIHKTLAQIDAELNVLEQTWGDLAGDAMFVSSVSQQHIYGLLFAVLWPLCFGRLIYRRRLVDATAIQQLCASTDAHARFIWVSSPALLRRMSPAINWSVMKDKVVEIFSSGAALPDSAVAELSEKYGRSALEAYGSSETGGIAIRRREPRSSVAWRPFAPIQCREGADGRLEIRSPYLPDDGWYTTDDLALFDQYGGFELLGRSDQLVKIEGKRVSLQKVTAALCALDEIQDTRVIVLASESRDLLGAVVVLTRSGLDEIYNTGKGAFVSQLRRKLHTTLDALSIPRKWRFVELIPMNEQGKFIAENAQAMFRRGNRVKLPEILGGYVEGQDRYFVLGVPAKLIYFEGHFEAAAVLPGVVQVNWAIGLGIDVFGIERQFLGMESVKFHRLVRPGDVIRLQLDMTADKLRFRYMCQDAIVSSGRIVFTD